MRNTNERIASWDTLRFILIIVAVVYHSDSFFRFSGNRILDFVTGYGGYFCNYFFFAISGILIAKKYRERIVNDEITLYTFLKKRFSAIYPLYIFSELLVIVHLLFLRKIHSVKISYIISDLLLITNGWVQTEEDHRTPYNYAAWFLCVLLLCYLIYYAICRLTARSKEAYLLAAGFVMFIGLYLEHRDFAYPFMQTQSGEGYMNFFAGVLLYELYKNVLQYHKKQTDILIIGGLTAVGIGSIFSTTNGFWGDKQVVVLLIAAALIYASVALPVISKAMKIKPFLWLGSISTELYLLHIPALMFTDDLLKRVDHSLFSQEILFMMYLSALIIVCFTVHQLRITLSGKRVSAAALQQK